MIMKFIQIDITKLMINLALIVSFVSFCQHASAAESMVSAPATTPDSISSGQHQSGRGDDVLFPEKSLPLFLSHFTWGAEIGSSIDMTSHDMSTVDADVVIGYKNSFFRIIGASIGIHRAIGTGDNFIPIYAIMRTSFRSKPSLLFFNLQLGYSFNTIGDSPTFGDACALIGCGINLAMSRRFQSHIILSAGYRHFNERHKTAVKLDTDNVYLAKLTFGVNF